MHNQIFCKCNNKGFLDFYLRTNEQDLFMFSQKYKYGSREFFEKGVSLEKALDTTNSHRNYAILLVMKKLPAYLRFLEKEHNIQLLEKTKNRGQSRSNKYDKNCPTQIKFAMVY